MKSFIVFAVLVASALAAPANPEAEAVIVKQVVDNIGVEGYSYDSETSNGIKQTESGQVKNIGTDNEALSVSGAFEYVGNDGNVYRVTYTADEEGFKPVGAHIPQA